MYSVVTILISMVILLRENCIYFALSKYIIANCYSFLYIYNDSRTNLKFIALSTFYQYPNVKHGLNVSLTIDKLLLDFR